MKTKVLVLSHSNLGRDPRVFRQIRTLREHYNVVTCGFAPSGFPDVRHIPLESHDLRPLDKADLAWRLAVGSESLVNARHPAVIATKKALHDLDFELALVNDAISLPAIVPHLKGRPLYFDAHEYAPLEFEEKRSWRTMWSPYYYKLCHRYLPFTRARTTVCQSIADEYKRTFGLPFDVIRNTPDFEDLSPTPTGDRVRLIHHGAAIRGRQLEIMAEVMAHLPESFELTFMLVPSDRSYLAELQEKFAKRPNIRFVASAPMPEIARTINSYDMGIFLLPENSFNNRYALPNKFFEFIQGRLGVISSPSPEMSRLVRELGIGLVTKDLDPLNIANEIKSISKEKIQRFKNNSHQNAMACSYNAQKDKFLSLVQKTIREGTRA